jgi:hypothetical protein
MSFAFGEFRPENHKTTLKAYSLRKSEEIQNTPKIAYLKRTSGLTQNRKLQGIHTIGAVRGGPFVDFRNFSQSSHFSSFSQAPCHSFVASSVSSDAKKIQTAIERLATLP